MSKKELHMQRYNKMVLIYSTILQLYDPIKMEELFFKNVDI